MQFTPDLRQALRLIDTAPGRLSRVFMPTQPCDLLQGSPDARAMFHPIPVVQVCLAGPLRVRFRRLTCDLAPGDAIVIPAATWYTAIYGTRQRGFMVGFGWLGRQADLWLEGPGLSLWAGMPLEPVRRLIRHSAAMDQVDRIGTVRELLRTVASEPLDGMRSVPAPIERMLDVVLRRLHLGPSATDLVRASGLGRSQAYALFTGFYGLSPRRALELRRLELAGALLATGHGVCEVAAACGWQNRETFSRAWSRQHGRPPRASRLPSGR